MERSFDYNYDYSYPTHDGLANSGSEAASGAMIVVMALVFLLIALASYVVCAIFRQRIFAKAGVEKWKAWVPFYNTYIMLQLGGQAGWWIFFMLFPPASMVTSVFLFIAEYHIQRKLDKSDAYLVLAILCQPVWLGILAFDKSVWDESKGAPRLDTQDQNQTAPTAGQPAAPDTAPAKPANGQPVPPVKK